MANLAFGTVIWKGVSVIADTVDVGNDPDEVLLEGFVTFTPEVEAVLVPQGVPDPYTAIPQPITGQLVAGDLKLNGQDLKLIATDSPTTLPLDWTYRVSFNLNVGGVPIAYDAFNIEVPANTVVDLSVVAPVGASAGIVTTDQAVATLLPGPSATRDAFDSLIVDAVEAHTPGIELGFAEFVGPTNFTTSAIAAGPTALITNLVVGPIIGQGRPVDILFSAGNVRHQVADTKITAYLEVNGSLVLPQCSSTNVSSPSTADGRGFTIVRRTILTAGVEYTIKGGIFGGVAGTTTLAAQTYAAAQLAVVSR